MLPHVAVLSSETGKSESEIRKAMSETLFLDTAQAQEFGLVKQVLEKMPMSK
jgi:ATP-dependent protease ClpP protease subunit